MKKFNNAEDAFKWAKEVIEKGCVTAEEVVAEEIYKDSKEFTYWQTGEMYKSGKLHSKFKEGIITERSPYVRRRYYEGGVPGGKNTKKIANKKPTYNPKAQPRWFEKTVEKYRDKYVKQGKKAIDEKKQVIK